MVGQRDAHRRPTEERGGALDDVVSDDTGWVAYLPHSKITLDKRACHLYTSIHDVAMVRHTREPTMTTQIRHSYRSETPKRFGTLNVSAKAWSLGSDNTEPSQLRGSAM